MKLPQSIVECTKCGSKINGYLNKHVCRPAAQHTPTPWQADGDYIQTVPDAQGFKSTIARIDFVSPLGMRQANRDLIVRAVNAHEELLTALSVLSDEMRQVLAYVKFGNPENKREAEKSLSLALEAIAKAEGK